MTNINEFIKQDNLEKMSDEELMALWGFILSDHEQIYTVDRIKKILDKRNN
jgi:hypothetical protein